MIRFKHDDTPSWSIASVDCTIFRKWEDGLLSAKEACEMIRKNNNLETLSVDEFIRSALELGYVGVDDEQRW